MEQPAEKKEEEKSTEHSVILGRTNTRTPNLLGRMDCKISLGNDRKI